jgi:hypothetical protein
MLLNDQRYRERQRKQAKGLKSPTLPVKPAHKVRARLTYCDGCHHYGICECGSDSDSTSIEQYYQEDPDREQVFYTSAVKGQKRFAVPVCSLCPGKPHLYCSCKKFLAMTPAQRREHLGKLRKCFRCFREGHGIKDCKSRIKCKTCQGDHDTLVCPKTKKTISTQKTLTTVNSQNNLYPCLFKPSKNKTWALTASNLTKNHP